MCPEFRIEEQQKIGKEKNVLWKTTLITTNERANKQTNCIRSQYLYLSTVYVVSLRHSKASSRKFPISSKHTKSDMSFCHNFSCDFPYRCAKLLQTKIKRLSSTFWRCIYGNVVSHTFVESAWVSVFYAWVSVFHD